MEHEAGSPIETRSSNVFPLGRGKEFLVVPCPPITSDISSPKPSSICANETSSPRATASYPSQMIRCVWARDAASFFPSSPPSSAGGSVGIRTDCADSAARTSAGGVFECDTAVLIAEWVQHLIHPLLWCLSGTLFSWARYGFLVGEKLLSNRGNKGNATALSKRSISILIGTSSTKTSPIATPSSPSQNAYGYSLSTTASLTPSSFVLLGGRSLMCSVSMSAN